MLYDSKIWVATDEDRRPVYLLPHMANRHGLIAGATGTGKTVTLKVMAEGFSLMGVPVFMGDIKGDLSGMLQPGNPEKIASRLKKVGVSQDAESFCAQTFPTEFWDVYGEQGLPIQTTVEEMGSVLLSRMLSLNDVQSGVLGVLFRAVKERDRCMADTVPCLETIQDLKDALMCLGANADEYTLRYGNVSRATVGAIQRAVAALEEQGGENFFGSSDFTLDRWRRVDENGLGYINILACDKLFLNPLMYSTFLLWMLTKLYETMPEVGDMEKPKMVFFFDEAHLLFDDCSKALMGKIEQIVRLIRSKGVGVYFITQSPADVPMTILGQLGNRVQHALRAYTPQDQRAVKVAATTFRANPAFSTEKAITQLKTGEALLSFLDEDGAPAMVTRATILPPQSHMGPVPENVREDCIRNSIYYHEPQPAVQPAPQIPQAQPVPFMNGAPAYVPPYQPGAPMGWIPPQPAPVMQPAWAPVYPGTPAAMATQPPVPPQPQQAAADNGERRVEWNAPGKTIPDNTPATETAIPEAPVFDAFNSTDPFSAEFAQAAQAAQSAMDAAAAQQPAQPAQPTSVPAGVWATAPTMHGGNVYAMGSKLYHTDTAIPQQPAVQSPQPQYIEMPVLVYDPKSYPVSQVKKQLMRYDPLTGTYTPAQPPEPSTIEAEASATPDKSATLADLAREAGNEALKKMKDTVQSVKDRLKF